MRVLNELDRFHLVIDVVKRLPQLGNRGAYTVQQMRDKLVEHRQYIAAHGVDLPEIANWQWTGSTSAATRLKASGTSVQKVYRLLRVDFPGGSRKKRT